MFRDFPGGPEAKTHPLNAGGPGLIPSLGARFHMLQPKILHSQINKCF